MARLTASDARREFFDLVRGAAERHQVYHVHHRKGSVVILSEEDYENLMETLELLSIPGFRESIQRSVEQMQRGETVPLDEVLPDE
jgi:antitoxin YefM